FDSDKLPVIVTIEPQVFFLQQIGGDRVSVEVLVPTGKEPETYTPTPDKIKRLARGKVFFQIGFPSEETLLPKLKTLCPNLLIVDTRDGIKLRSLESHSHAHETADDNNEEEKGNNASGHDLHENCGGTPDPHTWLSPTNAIIQAKKITETLIELDPAGKDVYQKNSEKLVAELEKLREELKTALEPASGKTIYVFHPAYGYFCDEFGLKQKAIEFEGKSPKAKELAEWVRNAKEDKVQVLLIQPEFNPVPAEKIAKEIGAKVIKHSTLGRDYFTELRDLAAIITNTN
ncbi:MAG: metal ABC transporter solute-binding protein, Zn/Mn family, partial [Thermoguttaceae bacterium]